MARIDFLGMGFGFVRGVFMITLMIVAIKLTSLRMKNIKKSLVYTPNSILWLLIYRVTFLNFIDKVKDFDKTTHSMDMVAAP